ncbi:MAG: hypothetical protein WC939_03620, partial [Acholeplasmataceae bacterium]
MHYEEDFQDSKVNLGTWKKILKTVFHNKKTITGLIFFASLMGVVDMLFTLFSAYAIRTFFEAQDYTHLNLFIVLVIIDAFLLGFSVWGFIRLAGKIEVETNYRLRKEAFETLQRLPF